MECRLSVFALRIYSRPDERLSMRGGEEQWIYWEESIWCRAAPTDGQMWLMCIRLHIQWHLTMEFQGVGGEETVLLISDQWKLFKVCSLETRVNRYKLTTQREWKGLYWYLHFHLETKSISLFHSSLPQSGFIPLLLWSFCHNRDVFHQTSCADSLVGGLLGGCWSNRGYPGEKLNSKAVGGQLVWVDLELQGRLNGKINRVR